MFFEGKGIDNSYMSAWKRRKEYREVYELLGSANFHEVSRFISEEWRSFKALLKAKRGLLPANPPDYRKKEGHRTPIIVIRYDQYKVDVEKKLHICVGVRGKRRRLNISFRGKLRWLRKGVRGRLVIKIRRRQKAVVCTHICGCMYAGAEAGTAHCWHRSWKRDFGSSSN